MAIPRVQERPDYGPYDVALIVSQPARVVRQGERLHLNRGFAPQLANHRPLHPERVSHLLDGFISRAAAKDEATNSGMRESCACCERTVPELDARLVEQCSPGFGR